MQQNADSCYIVTGNLDVWVKPLCEKLKIPAFTSTDIPFVLEDTKLEEKNIKLC